MEKVEETIGAICDWIQGRLNSDRCDTNHEVQEMTKALAELIHAKAFVENQTKKVSEYLAEELERAFKHL